MNCTPDDFQLGLWLGIIGALSFATLFFVVIHLVFGRPQ